MNLRPYQAELKRKIYDAWGTGHNNVLAVLPTGGGKTCVFSTIIAEHVGIPSVALAHRSELVSQMSLTLARNGVRHKVIGTPSLARTCAALHINELKHNYVSPHSKCAVASVDTLVRHDASDPWLQEVRLTIVDEAAHLCSDNKWGQAVRLFKNSKVLGVTATPCRADGKGLGRDADGIMDIMVEGPTTRTLIDDGWLTDYRIYAPPSDIDLSAVTISASGDYSPPKLAEAVHKSRIVGDIVSHYKKYAMGKLCTAFCVDVEAATDVAAAFRMAGISSEVITGKTPDILRQNLLNKFRNGEIKVLSSVDIFSEGFDMPAIEAIIMARPTQSFGLFAQQFGRALRLMDGKSHAIILDAVGNTLRHGLPDAYREWSLDRRERRTRNTPDDVIPLRICTNCLSAYERVYVACPYCGARPVPATRNAPDAVDGDLAEMSPELLAKLRGEVAAVDAAPQVPYGATPVIVASIHKRHRERLEALGVLRELMALWGGYRTTQGDSVAEQQRRWFLTFGVDVLSAQGLGRAEAVELADRVRETLFKAGVENERV